ncbi:MAG: translesion DNA synthesis-associated protein ImuA [Acidithiobacillus sp.]
MKPALESLLREHPRYLWRGLQSPEEGRATGGDAATLKTGREELDRLLGGWPRGGITEIHSSTPGIGELRLLLPLLATLSQQQKRWILWVTPPYLPYPPALAAAGLRLERMLCLHPRQRQDRLWALESALRSGTCSAVLAWPPPLDTTAWRRLQLAAQEGDTAAFFFFHEAQPSASGWAALRLELRPDPRGVAVAVQKRRGGMPGRGVVPLSEGEQLPLAIG